MCDNVCWCAVRSQMVQCNMYSVHVVSGVCLNMLCHRNTILRSENFKCAVLCSLEQVSLELLISMPWKFTTVSHITYIQYSTLSPPARVVAMQCRRLCAAGPDDHLQLPLFMQVHQTHQSPHQCGHVCGSSVVLHYHGATGSPHHQH